MKAICACVCLMATVCTAFRIAATPKGHFAVRRTSVHAVTAVRQPRCTHMALKGLAKKGKEAEVAKAKEELLASDPNSVVFKYLEEGKAAAGATAAANRPNALSTALRKKLNTLSVVAEYRRNLRSGFIKDILEPELLSPMFREGGASAVAVTTDRNSGGCSDADIRMIAKEQSLALGDFPGPLPIIVRDLVIDEFQIANAKAQGAAAVTLAMSLIDSSRAKELMDFADAIGLEAVVQAANKDEVEAAVSIGASIIAITGNQPAEAIELKQYIPDDVVAAVHVDRRSDEGLEEIEDCWLLRDSGYNCIWASEMLYKAGQMQTESVIAVIKAIRAKASVKYGRARGMSGKGEGAKEYLGTLAT